MKVAGDYFPLRWRNTTAVANPDMSSSSRQRLLFPILTNILVSSIFTLISYTTSEDSNLRRITS
jgi:hypothetical protein